MVLTVLNDKEVKDLLEELTLEEAGEFVHNLKTALHDYSNGTQGMTDAEIHQPDRTVIRSSSNKTTTLFMPSSSHVGYGIKVITLSSLPGKGEEVIDPAKLIRPTGAITLFHPNGCPSGIVHASTLTAFRTALSSACLVAKRNHVKSITAFGCGQQAFWHIRLALLYKGHSVRHVNIINRRFSDNCKTILKRLYSVPSYIKEREGWAECQFSVLTPGYGEFARLIREQTRSADVIFCCTPSTEPLFDHNILTSHEGRRKGRLIVAIGSFTPRMRELPVELLLQAVKAQERGHHHYHKHATEGGVVIVDTLDGALKESGEIIEAGLTPKQLIELGELVMIKRMKMEEEAADAGTPLSSVPSSEFEKLDLTSSGSAMSSVFSSSEERSSSRTSSPSRKGSFSSHHRSASQGSADRQKKKDDHLARWLQGGNVIYKSVGLGLMDLTVGMHLIDFARKKGVGAHIDGFDS